VYFCTDRTSFKLFKNGDNFRHQSTYDECCVGGWFCYKTGTVVSRERDEKVGSYINFIIKTLSGRRMHKDFLSYGISSRDVTKAKYYIISVDKRLSQNWLARDCEWLFGDFQTFFQDIIELNSTSF
jgi:hypothetical protein